MCVFFFFTSQMDFVCPSNWIICFPQSSTVEKASEYLGVNFLGAEVIQCWGEASAHLQLSSKALVLQPPKIWSSCLLCSPLWQCSKWQQSGHFGQLQQRACEPQLCCWNS